MGNKGLREAGKHTNHDTKLTQKTLSCHLFELCYCFWLVIK